MSAIQHFIDRPDEPAYHRIIQLFEEEPTAAEVRALEVYRILSTKKMKHMSPLSQSDAFKLVVGAYTTFLSESEQYKYMDAPERNEMVQHLVKALAGLPLNSRMTAAATRRANVGSFIIKKTADEAAVLQAFRDNPGKQDLESLGIQMYEWMIRKGRDNRIAADIVTKAYGKYYNDIGINGAHMSTMFKKALSAHQHRKPNSVASLGNAGVYTRLRSRRARARTANVPVPAARRSFKRLRYNKKLTMKAWMNKQSKFHRNQLVATRRSKHVRHAD